MNMFLGGFGLILLNMLKFLTNLIAIQKNDIASRKVVDWDFTKVTEFYSFEKYFRFLIKREELITA